MGIGRYGPRKIGEEQYEEEQATVKQAAHIYGPRKRGGGQERDDGPRRPDVDPSTETGGEDDNEVSLELERLKRENAELREQLESEASDPETPTEPETVDDGEESGASGDDGEATDPDAEDPGDADEDYGPSGADGYLSTREMKDALDANPALVDRFFEQEKDRKPKPRVSAYRLMIRAERGREDGGRDDMVERIEQAMEALA